MKQGCIERYAAVVWGCADAGAGAGVLPCGLMAMAAAVLFSWTAAAPLAVGSTFISKWPAVADAVLVISLAALAAARAAFCAMVASLMERWQEGSDAGEASPNPLPTRGGGGGGGASERSSGPATLCSVLQPFPPIHFTKRFLHSASQLLKHGKPQSAHSAMQAIGASTHLVWLQQHPPTSACDLR